MKTYGRDWEFDTKVIEQNCLSTENNKTFKSRNLFIIIISIDEQMIGFFNYGYDNKDVAENVRRKVSSYDERWKYIPINWWPHKTDEDYVITCSKWRPEEIKTSPRGYSYYLVPMYKETYEKIHGTVPEQGDV